MATFDISWKCLATDSQPTKTIIDQTKDQPKAQKTFAQALTNICEFSLSQIPQPVVKGDRLAIQIPEDDYIAGIDACKHNLHGRIIWPKGSTLLSVVVVKNVRTVRSFASWNRSPGLLKLFVWTHDFNPRAQHNSSAQVSPLRYKILVERKGFAFFVELDYEHKPYYCTGCKVIGHNVDNCRWNKEEEIKGTNEGNQRKKPPTESKKVFVQTRDSREQQGKKIEIINVEKETINVEESSSKNQQKLNEEETLHVKDKDQGNDTNIVLSPEDIFKQHDKVLEEELNSEHEKVASKGKTPSMDEDFSSNGSFVAATQSHEVEGLFEANSSHLDDTPERVKKDMNFLKESVANMADEVENSPTRLALKRFINQHKPDIILLAEPWMNFEDFPRKCDLLSIRMSSIYTLGPLYYCIGYELSFFRESSSRSDDIVSLIF
ncbi:hypothetical protein TSUD_146170 [Trifolium subterraneum]|uniref:DUF4283 domain-containing protein n=1 Tax=Trifolium subterraneum TaxID=3900 RepID=A0A2Z6P305_TRISU|nr:hypothetical protein TSUD_146170 [Trifolium subterraneum]